MIALSNLSSIENALVFMHGHLLNFSNIGILANGGAIKIVHPVLLVYKASYINNWKLLL